MKKCPFCAEDIQDHAILCRYCGRDVRTPVPPRPVQSVVTAQLQRRRKRRLGTVLAVLGFLATFTGGTGFGFILLWVGLWLALPGSAALRAGIGFVAAMFLLTPASAVRTQGLPRAKSPELSASSSTSAVVPIASSTLDRGRFDIVSIDSRITESNEVWSKFAWTLVLNSHAPETLNCRAAIEFLDADGLVVDDHNAFNLIVPPDQDETFTGYALLIASDVDSVQKTRAKVNCR